MFVFVPPWFHMLRLCGRCMFLSSSFFGAKGKSCISFLKTIFSQRFIISINFIQTDPVSILHKSIAGRYRPVRVADGPITARCRFIKNNSWGVAYSLHFKIQLNQL